MLKSAVLLVGLVTLASAVPLARREPETDAPTTDAPETDAPGSEDACHFVVVGASKYSKQPKCVDNDEEYHVRCCSTASSKPSTAGGWVQSNLDACDGLFSASQEMKDGDDHKKCRSKMTYDDAKAYCTDVDARLCTKTEMENDCTAGSGCSISGKYLWTSSTGTVATTTTEEPEEPQSTVEPPTSTEEPEEKPPTTSTEAPEPEAHLVEKNGKAQCEIEVLDSGKWSVRTAAKGYQGASYYCWEGRDAYHIRSAGRATLTYTVDISLPGRYQIEIRKFHDKADNTEGNDVWLQVDDLGWVKVYDGSLAKWTWDTYQSWENIPGKIWDDPRFEMGVGRHTIKISARSNGLCMDAIRIQHRPEDIPTTQAVTTRTARTTKQPKTMDDMQMIEVDGYAKAEVEDVDRNGWTKKTDVPGFSGTAYYKWGGKNRYQLSQAGKSGLLKFEVFITNPGDYTVQIRKYHDNEDNTLANDCWLEVDENEIVKVFDGTVAEWDETTLESWENRNLYLKKTNDPRYYLSAGFHTIRISARSNGLAIDSVAITKIDHTRVNPF